jgi:hypothetical protein
MKPLSLEMACLLGIQNEIQAVWLRIAIWNIFLEIEKLSEIKPPLMVELVTLPLF